MLAQCRGYILGGFCFALFAGSAWAQIAAIEGDVKGPDGQMVKGAVILIERQDMKGTYKGAKTDKKGHYIYNGLPFPGTYTVSVFIGDQKRDEMRGVRTQLGDPVNISFDLKKTADQQAAQAAAAGASATPGTAAPPEEQRGMSKEQKEALDKQNKENAAIIAKNKALNDTFNAGKDALAAKNYEAAADAFQKGVEMDPNQSVIWANMAEAYVGVADSKAGGDKDAALDESRRSLWQSHRAQAGQRRLSQQRRPGISSFEEVRRSTSGIHQSRHAGSSQRRPLLLHARRRVRERRASRRPRKWLSRRPSTRIRTMPKRNTNTRWLCRPSWPPTRRAKWWRRTE